MSPWTHIVLYKAITGNIFSKGKWFLASKQMKSSEKESENYSNNKNVGGTSAA